MPFSPKKCWGKNVTLTPVNIIMNCVFSFLGFIFIPVNNGYQWLNPAMIVNTAPIDNT